MNTPPPSFRPINETIDDLLHRWVQIEPPAAASIGPFTELAGALDAKSLAVIEGPRLPALDLALASALAFAKDGPAAVLIVDLRDWEIDLMQRLTLVATGIPELCAPRPTMSLEVVEQCEQVFIQLRRLPISITADRYSDVLGIRGLILSWTRSLPREGDGLKTLVVLAGAERLGTTAEHWCHHKVNAMSLQTAVLATVEQDGTQSLARQAYREADTFLRLELATSTPDRFQAVLEICRVRPPCALGLLTYSADRGAWSRQ